MTFTWLDLFELGVLEETESGRGATTLLAPDHSVSSSTTKLTAGKVDSSSAQGRDREDGPDRLAGCVPSTSLLAPAVSFELNDGAEPRHGTETGQLATPQPAAVSPPSPSAGGSAPYQTLGGAGRTTSEGKARPAPGGGF